MRVPEGIGEAEIEAILTTHGEWFQRNRIKPPHSLPTKKEFADTLIAEQTPTEENEEG